MARRSLISTGLIGFGVGLVVGSGFRRSSRFAAGVLERFGFEVDEMIWAGWEAIGQPEEPQVRQLEAPRSANRIVRRAVKRRAFSNMVRRPGALGLANS